MWSLKFRVRNLDSIYALLTDAHAVTDTFYPLSAARLSKRIHILGLHHLEGSQQAIKKFADELRRHPKTLRFERNESTIVLEMREEETFYDLLYSKLFYYPSPVIVSQGIEQWHIASWDRALLQQVIAAVQRDKKKLADFELLHLARLDVKDIYFPKPLPDIPEQQQRSFQLAVERGYYQMPRKAYLADLAKEAGISLSTFQEHLRKAEARLLPTFFSGRLSRT